MRRRPVQAAVLLGIGLLILYGVLRSVHPAQVADAIRHATPGWILVGAAAYAAFLVVRSWRWQVILRASAPAALLSDAAAVTAVGFAVNSVSPFKLGEVVRIAAIAPRIRPISAPTSSELRRECAEAFCDRAAVITLALSTFSANASCCWVVAFWS
jgi:hypothetical protein